MKKNILRSVEGIGVAGILLAVALAACSASSTGVGTNDAGVDGTSTAAYCSSDADCAASAPATTPASCAVGKCDALQGKCSFVAVDHDGDGHPTARCQVTGGGDVQVGDDCNDDDPNLYPGHPESCSTNADGTAITWPTGAPTGACHFGQVQCLTDGTVSACQGAQAPAPRDCSSPLDNDCDGKPDNTNDAVCNCVPGQTYDCSSDAAGTIVWPAGTWGQGPAPSSVCHTGKALCGANGQQQACSGAQRPKTRDCNSNADNDCDGIVDNRDVTCECDGSTIGTSRACGTHPQDGVGVCHAGSQKCVIDPADSTKAHWEVCTGGVGPAPKPTCTSTLDNDCNGAADNTQYVACGNQPAPQSTDGTSCAAQQCGSDTTTCAVIATTNSTYCHDADGDGYCGSACQSVACATIAYDANHRPCAQSPGLDACDNQPGHSALAQACAAVGDCCPAPGGTTLSCLAGACHACANAGTSCTAGSGACCPGTKCNSSSVCQTCAPLGQACSVTADCCSGSCVGGVCTNVTCRAPGASCSSGAQCCNGSCFKQNNVMVCN
jgi:hypothetical protein